MREFDVIVVGASGYTGQRVCEYLAGRARQTGQRWAVAGRRADVLAPLAEKHGASGAIAADCTLPGEAAELAARGAAIANLAGPYYGRAETLVGACAAAGTHYLDLTGELVFVRDIIDRFHDTARESGARIAPVAGYEALPFDLMALALLEGYMTRHGASPARIDLLGGAMQPPPDAKGLGEIISGGTAETMRVMLEHDFSGLAADPTALNPAGDPDRDEIRRAMPYDMTPRPDDLEPLVHADLPRALPAPGRGQPHLRPAAPRAGAGLDRHPLPRAPEHGRPGRRLRRARRLPDVGQRVRDGVAVDHAAQIPAPRS